MLKRVNIQYTIDLDELPDEIDRIYDNAKNIFNNLSLPEASGKDILTSEVLIKLDETRKKLTYLDHILSDVSGIVGSYVEYELSNITNNQKQPPEISQSVENSIEVS